MTPLGPLALALQPWQNFYLLVGTAAATLTGLMFIAVTFGSSLVTRETAQTTRAFVDPTYMHFVQVLLTACLVTIPTLGPVVLGSVLVVAVAWRLVHLYSPGVRPPPGGAAHARRDIGLSEHKAMLVVLPLLCHLLVVATGVGFARHDPASLTSLAVVNLGLLFTVQDQRLGASRLDGSCRERAPPRSTRPGRLSAVRVEPVGPATHPWQEVPRASSRRRARREDRGAPRQGPRESRRPRRTHRGERDESGPRATSIDRTTSEPDLGREESVGHGEDRPERAWHVARSRSRPRRRRRRAPRGTTRVDSARAAETCSSNSATDGTAARRTRGARPRRIALDERARHRRAPATRTHPGAGARSLWALFGH